jgi:hypothetical protein
MARPAKMDSEGGWYQRGWDFKCIAIRSGAEINGLRIP